MAFVPTSRLEQAIMFELEHVVEAALRKAIPAAADETLETTRHVSAGSYKDLEENIYGRCLYFIKLAPKDRLAALPEVMRSFDRLYGLFKQAERKRARAAIPLAALRDKEDWPHFDW